MYSMEYMEGDRSLRRYMQYIMVFTSFMIVVVISKNWLCMFLGWEGVGICSYLLISYWYGRQETGKNGIQAVMCNRVGDVGLMIGMIG